MTYGTYALRSYDIQYTEKRFSDTNDRLYVVKTYGLSAGEITNHRIHLVYFCALDTDWLNTHTGEYVWKRIGRFSTYGEFALDANGCHDDVSINQRRRRPLTFLRLVYIAFVPTRYPSGRVWRQCGCFVFLYHKIAGNYSLWNVKSTGCFCVSHGCRNDSPITGELTLQDCDKIGSH